MKPYFYIIRHKSSGVYYAGSKRSKHSNPDNLLKENGYTTSSKVVNQIIADEGITSFEIVKIRVFDTPEQAYQYETRFLKRVNAANNPSFLNMHNNNLTLGYETDGTLITYNSIGGKMQGARNVESGHMERIRSMIDHEKRVEALKKSMYENKTGWLSLTEEQQKMYASMGGSVQGRRNAENGHMDRIRAMVDEEKRIKNVKKALHEKRTGCFLDDELRRKSSSLGGKVQGKRNAESGHLSRIATSYWDDVRSGKIVRLKRSWYNNGDTETQFKEGEIIPDGFVKGRIKR
jgi:hypothetical protein